METIVLDYTSLSEVFTTTVTLDIPQERQRPPVKLPEGIKGLTGVYVEYSLDWNRSLNHFVFDYHKHRFRIMKDWVSSSKGGCGYILFILLPSGEWQTLKKSVFADYRSLMNLTNYVKAIY